MRIAANACRDNLRYFCRPLGCDPGSTAGLDELFVNARHLCRREWLYRAGDACTTLHLVRRGSLKTVVVDDAGDEHITGLHLPGDVVGLDGLGQPRHGCDAIALEDTEVASLASSHFDRLRIDPSQWQLLFRLMAQGLRRSHDLILLLGGMSAGEKLATLLLDLTRRQRDRGEPDHELMLRMTREEVASFLGLELETVSRTLSRLQGEGLIRVQGRAVTLVDRPGLMRLAGQPL